MRIDYNSSSSTTAQAISWTAFYLYADFKRYSESQALNAYRIRDPELQIPIRAELEAKEGEITYDNYRSFV